MRMPCSYSILYIILDTIYIDASFFLYGQAAGNHGPVALATIGIPKLSIYFLSDGLGRRVLVVSVKLNLSGTT